MARMDSMCFSESEASVSKPKGCIIPLCIVHDTYAKGGSPLPRNNRAELIPVLAILELTVLFFRDRAHDSRCTNLGRLRAATSGHCCRVVARIERDNAELGQTRFQLASKVDRQCIDGGLGAIVRLPTGDK
jgi:hypothetical protein